MRLRWLLITILTIAIISAAFLVYLVFYPGAVFVFGELVCLLALLTIVTAAMFIKYKNRWWLLPLITLSAILLLILISGCERLYHSWYWIHHNPDSYPNGKIEEGYVDGIVKVNLEIVQRDSRQTVILTVNCTNQSIQKGGGLILRLGKIIPVSGQPRFYDCFYQDMWNNVLQVNRPEGQGFVTVRGPNGAELTLSKPPAPDDSFIVNTYVRDLALFRLDKSQPIYYPLNAAHRHEIHMKVEKGTVPAGENIDFVLGDTMQGGSGWIVPGGEADIDFVVYVDTASDGKFRMLNSFATLEVSGRSMQTLEVIAPSTPTVGDNFRVAVRALDDKGYLSMHHEGQFTVMLQNGLKIDKHSYEFREQDRGVVEFEVNAINPGTYRLQVRSSSDGRIFTGNPMWVRAVGEDNNIYWGDLHQHTTLGKDANRTPEWVFEHNIKVDRFDFAAISIHDLFDYWGIPPTKAEFAYLEELSDHHNREGEFVTLKGFEWTSFKQGHRNIYFDVSEGPEIITCQQAATPGELRMALEGRKYMLIPHHTAWRFLYEERPNNWGDIDWKETRLVEIYSKHGSSDYYAGLYPIHHDVVPPYFYLLGRSSNRAHEGDGSYVREALAAGYRLGIICGGDNHWARGGKGFGTGVTADYSGGVQAVYSPALARSDIYNAMWQRCTYGTTGVRIILDFMINGSPMGSELTISQNEVDIHFSVKGTAPIKRIELWQYDRSEGYLAACFDGAGRLDIEQSYQSGNIRKNSFYFLHVIQEDGQLAWSSPIWIDIMR